MRISYSTGYGYHADYMMGWPEDVLQKAMTQCTDSSGQVSSCSILHSRSEQEMNDCALPPRVDEHFDGCMLLPYIPFRPFSTSLIRLSNCFRARQTPWLQHRTTRPRSRYARHWLRCSHRDPARDRRQLVQEDRRLAGRRVRGGVERPGPAHRWLIDRQLAHDREVPEHVCAEGLHVCWCQEQEHLLVRQLVRHEQGLFQLRLQPPVRG